MYLLFIKAKIEKNKGEETTKITCNVIIREINKYVR